MACVPDLHSVMIQLYMPLGYPNQAIIFTNILWFILVSSKFSIFMKKAENLILRPVLKSALNDIFFSTVINCQRRQETKHQHPKKIAFKREFIFCFFSRIHTVPYPIPYLMTVGDSGKSNVNFVPIGPPPRGSDLDNSGNSDKGRGCFRGIILTEVIWKLFTSIINNCL